MDGEIQREYDGESLSSRQEPVLSRRRRSSVVPVNRFGFFSELGKWKVWKAILLGQVISGLLCGTGVSSQFLQGNYKVYVPTAQSFLNYVLLCMVFTTWLACRSGEQGLIPVLRKRGWKYFLISVVDVEANFLIVKAYQYTTLTSVQLLDCFTIPTVLALSWLVLKIRFKIIHILGVGVALVGVGCLIWADTIDEKSGQEASNRLLGDMLCLSGAALYGTSNVAEEYYVKSYDIIEFLGMLGLFGSVINGIQLAILEREEIATINWDKWQEVVLLVGFSLCLFFIYITMPVVLKLSSATTANLSILTADFYSLAIGLYVFDFKFHWLYFVSFFLVMLGVVVYSLKPTPLTTVRYHEMAIALEAQGEVEGSHQAQCSTICSYNSIASTRDHSMFSLNSEDLQVAAKNEHNAAVMAATAANDARNIHSASVHMAHEEDNDLRYQRPVEVMDRRNGSAVIPRDNRC